jgi:hypothetical protein
VNTALLFLGSTFAPVAAAPAHDPAALVEQLGSPDAVAEATAGRQLRKLGLRAECALRVGLKSDDPAVRTRCAALLADIRNDALNQLMRAFDTRALSTPDHPLWNRFKEIAGDTRASRNLFVRFVAQTRGAAADETGHWLGRLDAARSDPEAAGRLYREALPEPVPNRI